MEDFGRTIEILKLGNSWTFIININEKDNLIWAIADKLTGSYKLSVREKSHVHCTKGFCKTQNRHASRQDYKL